MNDTAFQKLCEIKEEFESLHTVMPSSKDADKLALALRNYFSLILSLHIPDENGELKKLDAKDLKAIVAAHDRLLQAGYRLSKKPEVQNKVNSLLKAVRQYHAWCFAEASSVDRLDIVQIENLAAERDLIREAKLTSEAVNQVISDKETLRSSAEATGSNYKEFTQKLHLLKDPCNEINKAILEKLDSIGGALTTLFLKKSQFCDTIPDSILDYPLNDVMGRYVLPREIETLKELNYSLIKEIDPYISYLCKNNSLWRGMSPDAREKRNAVNTVVSKIYLAALTELKAYALQSFRVEQKLVPVMRLVRLKATRLEQLYGKRNNFRVEVLALQLLKRNLLNLYWEVYNQDEWLSKAKKSMDDLKFPNLSPEEIERNSRKKERLPKNQKNEISEREKGKKTSRDFKESKESLERILGKKDLSSAKDGDVQPKVSNVSNPDRKKKGRCINTQNVAKSTSRRAINMNCGNPGQGRYTNRIPIHFNGQVNRRSSGGLQNVNQEIPKIPPRLYQFYQSPVQLNLHSKACAANQTARQQARVVHHPKINIMTYRTWAERQQQQQQTGAAYPGQTAYKRRVTKWRA